MRYHALALGSCLLVACTQPAPSLPPSSDAGSRSAPAPDRTPPSEAPAPVIATIPARFHGTWAADAAACAAAGDPSRLAVAADTLHFHESSGPLKRIEVNGDDLSVTVTLTGEGETRDASYRFTLSDGDTVLTDRDAGLVRRRCGR